MAICQGGATHGFGRARRLPRGSARSRSRGPRSETVVRLELTGSASPRQILSLWAAGRRDWMPAADPLSARHLDRRFPESALDAARQGWAEPVAVGDLRPEGAMAGRVRAWRKRDLSARRYVYVRGRRRLPAGPDGGSQRKYTGFARCPRGQERADRRQVGVRGSAQS